ncbi:hypothetical protein BD410DRAFT_789826, partial [Rickenella mellea]
MSNLSSHISAHFCHVGRARTMKRICDLAKLAVEAKKFVDGAFVAVSHPSNVSNGHVLLVAPFDDEFSQRYAQTTHCVLSLTHSNQEIPDLSYNLVTTNSNKHIFCEIETTFFYARHC